MKIFKARMINRLSAVLVIVLLVACHKKDTILPGGNPNTLKANFKFKLDSTDNTNRTVIFTDSSRNAVSWFWHFGDDSTSTEKNPKHVYLDVTPGAIKKFAVKLVVTNTAGVRDSIVDSIAVGKHIIPTATNIIAGRDFNYHFLIANDSADFTKIGTDVTFNATTSNAKTYDWDFGDSNHDTAANPIHSYTKSGTYTVMLTVTSISGDQAQTTIATPITVNVYDGVTLKALNIVAKPPFTDTSKYLFAVVDTSINTFIINSNDPYIDSHNHDFKNWNFDSSNSMGFATKLDNGANFSTKVNGNAIGIASTADTLGTYLTSSQDLWKIAIKADPDNIDNLINLTRPITSNDRNAMPRAGYIEVDVQNTRNTMMNLPLTIRLFIQLHKAK